MKSHKAVILSVAFVVGMVWLVTSAHCQQMGEKPQYLPFKTDIPAFQKYRLLLAWQGVWPSPPRPCLWAITPNGQILHMPEDFQKMIRTEHLSVSSSETALDLATTYVTLTSPFKVVVLSNLGMIPGVDRAPHQFAFSISAPVVDRSDGNYVVHLFAWKQIGGIIEEWEIRI